MTDKLNLDSFQFDIKRKESPENNIVALVTLDYLGLKIKGFRIYSKTDKITGEIIRWVGPPQYYNHARKKYCTLFWMDRALWKKLEKIILAEYLSLVRYSKN
ncbi:MAG: hypothetical protein WCP14_04355 [bacterium]